MATAREPASAGPGPAVPPRTLVVVPCLNEAASVASVVRAVRTQAPHAHVLVVDDHSLDDTAVVARAAGATVVRLPYTLGVGGAMRTGYGYALRHGYAVVVQVDGDGQHDVRDLPRLVASLAGADVVIGARFADDTPYEVGGARRFAMRILAAVMSLVVGTRITDSTSGYRALGPRAVRLFAEHYPAEYLGDTVEALVIARKCGLVVRDRAGTRPAHSGSSPVRGVLGPRLGGSRARAGASVDVPASAGGDLVRPDGYWLGLVGGLVVLAMSLELVRRRFVRGRLAIAWLVLGSLSVVFALFPSLLISLTSLVGVQVPLNLVLFAGVLFLLVVSMQLASEVGRLESRTRRLAEEIGVLGAEVDRLVRRAEGERAGHEGAPDRTEAGSD